MTRNLQTREMIETESDSSPSRGPQGKEKDPRYLLIIDAIGRGVPMKLACEAHGVNDSTFALHCQQNAELGKLRARARMELCEELIAQANDPERHPQAAMFRLERQFREEFGKPIDTQIAVQQNMVNSGNSGPTEEERAKVLRDLAQRELAAPESIPVRVIEEGGK